MGSRALLNLGLAALAAVLVRVVIYKPGIEPDPAPQPLTTALDPADAVSLLQQHADAITKDGQLALAGSSLGGFYATWLAEHYHCPAVLINPAVKPHELLEKYLGENTNYYTDERWVLDNTHIDQFRRLYIENITDPQRYFLLLQTGDQTLDYREAEQKYRGSPSLIEQGGSHEFSGFERHLDKILKFCNVI